MNLPAVADGGPSIETVTGDVSSDEDWTHVIAVCRDRFARLDVLFNNAGDRGSARFDDSTTRSPNSTA